MSARVRSTFPTRTYDDESTMIMNPRAGDTVTSTKATSPTIIITTTTTTGEQRTRRAAIPSHTRSATMKLARKRRQQTDNVSIKQQMFNPEAIPSPEKSLRRREAPSVERTSSKNRLGGFLSNLATRIRKPKSATMSSNKDSVNQRVDRDSEMAQPTVKRDANDEVTQDMNADFNKRRKIELDESVSNINLKENNDILSNDVNLTKDECNESKIIHKRKNKFSIKKLEDTSKLTVNDYNVNINQCERKEADTLVTNSITDQNNFEETSESSVKDFVVNIDQCKQKEITDQNNLEERNKLTVNDSNSSSDKTKSDIISTCRNIVANEFEKVRDTDESCVSLNKSNECECTTKKFDEDKALKIENSNSKEMKDAESESTEISSVSAISLRSASNTARRDDTSRLRKNIQWLEECARRLREELAGVRSELHEERRAAKLARREFDAAIRDVKNTEAVKYNGIISELKARLSQIPSRSTMDSLPSSSKSELLKDENHRREMAALKKRLTEAECMIKKLKVNSLDQGQARKKIKEGENYRLDNAEVRKLEIEVQSLRAANKKLEEQLHIAEESARNRAAEVRSQHENHGAELLALQKALRSDTIKMIDEIQSKNRVIEKLEKLVSDYEQMNQKLRAKEDEMMRKLRESERSHQIRLAPKIEKIHHEEHVMDLCKVECEDDANGTELDRLRELAVEQQEIIEVLRQAVKEKERKLEQLSNKRRKEEFYRQWLELDPVAEVDDEDEQQHVEEGDSALSSAPSSLSPQPGIGGNNASGVSREAYESVLLEIEELQTKLMEEQRELVHARSQVRDLEKALLQETRGSQNSRRALSEKLREAEEREAALVAEISELREQNELLEFRVLELEESPNPRDTPDPADSGIVSPEPIHLYKDHQVSKHRDRAIATVMPYTSTYNHAVLPSDPQKAPLSLQESGIFEEEPEEEVEIEENVQSDEVRLSSQSTQTEAPAGELLQEVQRLQELRARIQERAAKVPLSPTSDRKNDNSCEFALDVTPLRERIRELEERVKSYESERELSKQREEELLDENYRLTEKMYGLDVELKKLQEKINRVRLTNDAETMTEEEEEEEKEEEEEEEEEEIQRTQHLDNIDSSMTRTQKLYQTAIENLHEYGSSKKDEKTLCNSEAVSSDQRPCIDCNDLWKDCDTRIQNLARTEFCLRQQIASLEHRESAFFETLRQADATWAKLEADYEAKQKEMTERLTAQIELNKALFDHLTKLNKTSDDPLQTISNKREEEEEEAEAKEEAEAMEVDDETQTCNRIEESKASQTDEFELCKCQRTITISRSSQASSGVVLKADSCKTSTISRTRIKLTTSGSDEIDAKVIPSTEVNPPTEVATEAKEDETIGSSVRVQSQLPEEEEQQEESNQNDDEPEALVSIDRSSSDKKQIIYFRWR